MFEGVGDTPGRGRASTVVVRVGNRVCALPLATVIETMRPLPVEPVRGAPPFVLGISIIRGAPTPVVDAAALIGASRGASDRVVTLRAGARVVALVVDAVLGVHTIAVDSLAALPPLLGDAAREVVTAVGTLDAQLLLVLDAARVIPDDVLATLEGQA
jgi:purine-binding chemotaxis protein CheW